jgi:hypothetical protein
MSDQFQRHARQFQQDASRRSIERSRQWQQDMFRHQRDMHVVWDARQRSKQDTPGTAADDHPRGRGIIRAIAAVLVLAALAVGAYLLIRSGQLSDWLDLKDF